MDKSPLLLEHNVSLFVIPWNFSGRGLNAFPRNVYLYTCTVFSPEPVIKRTWTGMPAQFTIPESGTIQVCGAVISIDDKTNKATSIKRIFVIK